MSESYEFDHVDFVTAGAVGAPGARTFYVQVEAGGRRIAFVAEKGQVRSLAQLAQELLARVGVTVTPDDLDEGAQRLREPVQAVWRTGAVSLGVDDAAGRFLIELEELPSEGTDGEPGSARFWVTAEQMAALAAHAAYAVEAGARPTCRFCSYPIDAEGHVCPTMNGHGPVSA